MANTIRTLLLFLFTLLLTTSSLSKDLCHPDDKTALLKIKKAFNNPYHLASWDPKEDCCSWYSLECGGANVNHRVTALTIFSGEISGQIPPEVGDLPYLDNLMFHKLTNLTGHIPPTIAKLKRLRYLRLTWTKLTGPVPSFLSQLKNLEDLDLSFNALSGSIPALLPKLTYLDLSSIPESFGSFPGKVTSILLSHNQLSGSIPKSLGNYDFNRIDFSRNKLVGDASMLFGSNKTTWGIDLSRNMFQFDISKIKISKTLNIFNLDHNRITGNIPVQWTKLEQLQSFNVSYNALCGRIPQGGGLQRFDSYSYFHNKCLCGAPLQSCK